MGSPYQQSLNYIFSLLKFGIKLGLSNINSILQKLQNPHTRFKVIHIGGTNGKGSTAAIVNLILLKAGYRVGLYTSPHLIEFTERIKINNIEISESKVVEITNLIKDKIDILRIKPTFFEFITAMAFVFFALENVDVGVVEVGMGGRLDATNTVSPIASVITNVSLDHTEELGRDIFDIAREKAGIIKKEVPVITSSREKCVRDLIEKIGFDMNCNVYMIDRDFSVEKTSNNLFNYNGIKLRLNNLKTNLIGAHQVLNAATAIAAIEVIQDEKFCISRYDITDGLSDVSWPGRCELLKGEPTVILDGAHNVDGADKLSDTIKNEFEFRRIITVFGVMKDKDIKGITKKIFNISDFAIITKIDIPRCAEPDVIFEIAKSFQDKLCIIPNIEDAIDRAILLAERDGVILVTGSLYIVGEARRYLINNKDKFNRMKKIQC